MRFLWLIALLTLIAPARLAAEAAPGRPDQRVALFLARQFFSDEEYEPLARRFERAGLPVALLSVDTGVIVSASRVILNADLALKEASADSFAALVLVGGPGMVLHWDDELLHGLCREFAAAGKPLAAIGIAPVALARAGVLKDRRATVFLERPAVAELRAAGARHSFRTLVSDRNIITAAEARRAADLGLAVVRAVTGRQ